MIARGFGGWSVYVLRRIGVWSAMPKHGPHPLWYTGISRDPKERLLEHNSGKCRTTRGGIYVHAFLVGGFSTDQAREIERWLKTGDTIGKRNRLIDWWYDVGPVKPGAIEFNDRFGHEISLWRLRQDKRKACTWRSKQNAPIW